MQDENPYQSPTQPCFVEPVFPKEPLPASTSRRLANFLLDYAAYMLLSAAIGFVIGVIQVVFHTEHITGRAIDGVPDIVFGIGVLLIYYIPQEALWGRTLAKLVTGTRVVSATGAKPTFGQIVGRTFCRMIPFELFSFLFGGGNPVGWHDRFSNTRVVMNRQSPGS